MIETTPKKYQRISKIWPDTKLLKRNLIYRQNCCKCITSEFLDPCKTQPKYQVQFFIAYCQKRMQTSRTESGFKRALAHTNTREFSTVGKTLGRDVWFRFQKTMALSSDFLEAEEICTQTVFNVTDTAAGVRQLPAKCCLLEGLSQAFS